MSGPSNGLHSKLIAVAVILLATGAGHVSLSRGIADLDSFYHLGHAAQYLASSPFDTAFPWARFSVVGDLGADLWWGFHQLLIPFSTAAELETGIQIAGVVLTAVLLVGVLSIVLRHGMVAPWLWPVLFFAAVPNVLFRYLMVRPHILALLAALFLLSFLARGRWWQAALATAALTWIDLNLFWTAPVVLGGFLAARVLDQWLVKPWAESSDLNRMVPPSAAIGAVVLGCLTGWLLRPHPMAAARLVDTQLFLLLRERARDLPMSIPGDMMPLPHEAFAASAWPLLILLVGASVIALWSLVVKRSVLGQMPTPERTMLWATLLLSGGFLVLTLVLARRALVEWSAFSLLAVSVTVSFLFGSGGLRKGLVWGVAALGLLSGPWIVDMHRRNVRQEAIAPDYLAEAADWLEENSDTGDLVFHARWDNFGPLFGRNRVNHYLVGMHPIFLFAHDEELYWEFTYLSADVLTDRTCGVYPCDPSSPHIDTHQALLEDFGARWVFIEPHRNPRLFDYFRNDPRYTPRFWTDTEAVFEVLPGPG